MAVFEYKGLSSGGKQVKGVVDAENARAARQKLRSQGIFPTSLIESTQKSSSRSWNISLGFKNKNKVGANQLCVATRQLATLVGAGIPLLESLRALSEQLDHAGLKRIVADVADRVNEGSTLANALREYPAVFPRLYTNMVASGEASGSLELVLERLAELMEGQLELRRKVISALTYPSLMLVLCIVVILLLLSYVVPQITAVFEDRGATLPLATRIVIGLSSLTKNYWWIFLGLIAALVAGLKHYSKSSAGRKKLDSLKLRIPFFGLLSLKLATSRLARNLGAMLGSGIPLLTALGIARNIIGNVILEEAVDEAIVGVREGSSLASELNKSKLFPMLLIRMVAVGEKTGQLEHLLLRAASSYESEVNSVISALTSILEPVMILVIAVIVGGILASVMLPMLEMSSLAGV